MKNSGFTFVELIVVILLVGILSIFVAPRFFADNDFKARGIADEIISAIRHAQRLSMTRGENHRIIINNASYTVEKFVGGVSTPVRHPDGSITFSKPIDTNITISTGVNPLTIDFDTLGRPSPNTTPTFPLSIGVGNFTIQIEEETGYAHL